jgi:osmotically-inducible protein OsmY
MRTKVLGLAAVICMMLAVACAKHTSSISYEEGVKNALKQAELTDVNVSEDATKNTVTLSGKVHSEDAKLQAARVAQTAGGDRLIVNEISVQPVGVESDAKDVAKNSDEAIEKNYKAVLIAQGLDKQRINYDAKNGVLTLAGSVKSVPQRVEAEKLAQAVPNVQQVVNQIEIKR